ncbi:MAG TPA: hypothetical protein VF398_08735 [bacterium]
MAKVQTFGDKVAKAQKTAKKCPICDAPLSYYKIVSPVAIGSGSYRFNTRVAKICKCNEAELKVA